MLFNEALQNLIDDVDTMPSRLAIEAKFREKILTILGFVYGRPVAEQVLDFHITNSMYGCVIEVKGYGFTLTSIHTNSVSMPGWSIRSSALQMSRCGQLNRICST